MEFTDRQLKDLTEDQLDAIQAALERHRDEVSENPEDFAYSPEGVDKLSRQLLKEMKRRYGD